MKPTPNRWRMDKMCDTCPFMSDGAGMFLRKTLRGNRWRQIIASLKRYEIFRCHKTTEHDDDTGEALPGIGLICAGAIAWQKRHRCVPQLVQVMERLKCLKRS